MCIAYLALGAHRDWPVLIAANRDEFHARPTRAAAPWPQQPDIIAGCDIRAGGTWLGVRRDGRYALVTNYRDPAAGLQPAAPSRGALVSDFLAGDLGAGAYMRQVHARAAAYNGFNLIVGDAAGAYYLGNRDPAGQVRALAPGRYVLSNHLLDTPWPKSRRLRAALDALDPSGLDRSLAPVFEILRDATPAEDHALPRTGIPLERERLLSSPFIVSPDYGTRCSTVVAMRADGRCMLSETTYDPQGIAVERHDWPYERAARNAASNTANA
jgi:uncharacterized protein with NRDE domain